MPGENDVNFVPNIAHNPSAYAAIQMESSYLNTVKKHFGNRFRQVVNYILNTKALEEQQIIQVMARSTRQEVDDAIRQLVHVPAAAFKVALNIAIIGAKDRRLPATLN